MIDLNDAQHNLQCSRAKSHKQIWSTDEYKDVLIKNIYLRGAMALNFNENTFIVCGGILVMKGESDPSKIRHLTNCFAMQSGEPTMGHFARLSTERYQGIASE